MTPSSSSISEFTVGQPIGLTLYQTTNQVLGRVTPLVGFSEKELADMKALDIEPPKLLQMTTPAGTTLRATEENFFELTQSQLVLLESLEEDARAQGGWYDGRLGSPQGIQDEN
jgi:hypothetical protein